MIYENRFDLNPECLRIGEAIKQKVLPNDCPFVQGIPGYKSVVIF